MLMMKWQGTLNNKAAREGLSVNKQSLKLIRETLAPRNARRSAVYDDLDHRIITSFS